jgi:hypothetical protein
MITPEALEALKNAINDPDALVAEAAQQALNVHLGLAEQATAETPEPLEGSSKQPKKQKDFDKGLMVSLLLNVLPLLVFLCFLVMESLAHAEGGTGPGTGFLMSFGGLWMLVNLIVIIILALIRREILKGLVAGFAIGLLITIVAGVFLGAICYSAMGSV